MGLWWQMNTNNSSWTNLWSTFNVKFRNEFNNHITWVFYLLLCQSQWCCGLNSLNSFEINFVGTVWICKRTLANKGFDKNKSFSIEAKYNFFFFLLTKCFQMAQPFQILYWKKQYTKSCIIRHHDNPFWILKNKIKKSNFLKWLGIHFTKVKFIHEIAKLNYQKIKKGEKHVPNLIFHVFE